MGLARLGRTLRARGRKVWVISLTEKGAVGHRVGIDLFGGTRLLEAKELWQGEQLPDPEKLGFKAGEGVIILVPRSWVLLKQLSFPHLKPEQLAAVVPFELEEALPKTGEVYTAWQQIPKTQGTGAIAFAVASRTLAPVLELFQRAGLSLWGIAPHSWAQATALSWTVNCKGEQVLLLACGERAEFSLVADGSLTYSYQGGENLFADLKTFQKAQGKPERLIVTGDYPAALIGELRGEGFAPEEVSSPLPLALATVSSYIKGSFPDLSPPSQKEGRQRREERVGNYFLIGLATIAIFSFLGWQAGYHRNLMEKHNQATARIAQLEARQGEKLQQSPEFSQRSEWLSTWAAINQALPSEVWLSELRLERNSQIGIMGFALAQTDVATMMGNLSAQALGPVILNYSRRKEIGERQVTEFYILCGKKDGP